MPITYQHTISDPSTSISTTIQDADSSIVLSDLVRSGETSRLRRRGAVRLDHMPRSDDPRASSNGASGSSVEDSFFQLYCRECDTPSNLSFSSPLTPYRPSLFPSTLPNSNHSKENQLHSQRLYHRTLIHSGVMAQRLPHIDASLHVHPPSTSSYPPTAAQVHAFLTRFQRTRGSSDLYGFRQEPELDVRELDFENGVLVWTSVSDPVDGVLAPMHYEDHPKQSTESTDATDTRFMTLGELATRRPGPISTACMCKREVVGCATCGSPLGMRYTPCSSAVKKIFSPPAPRSAPRPSGYSRPRMMLAPRSVQQTLPTATISHDPETSIYRSRVANYLLASMETPRSATSAHNAPSPPEPIRVTPETHHDLNHGRPFEVSILPRRVRSHNLLNRNSVSIAREQEPSESPSESGSSSQTVTILDRRNDAGEPGERSPLAQLHPSPAVPLSDAETVTDTETDNDNDEDEDSDNDDHYRLPMITQSGRDHSGVRRVIGR
ncbi:hypothetical protein D9757_011867 [Collybiopsis confluens]|uniref:Uncharacterized protein n=1 Tax=Collybiopsis confluens TaxID=2823264 RepID=A0A8H5D5E6_9AGAR|nr:hypothetical protein D9757_011867 [Collybiopsis confluens]